MHRGGGAGAKRLWRLFGSRRMPSAPAGRGLFLINLKVGRGSNATMPATLAGAYVSAYVTAPDDETATRLAVTRLTARGYEYLSTHSPVTRLDPAEWSRHVVQSWPEFIDELPSQDEVTAGLSSEMVFFGPFVGFERRPEH